MKNNMKATRNKKWGAMNKVCRVLGLSKIGGGIYATPSGKIIDLTATAPERLAVLHTIGLQAIG